MFLWTEVCTHGIPHCACTLVVRVGAAYRFRVGRYFWWAIQALNASSDVRQRSAQLKSTAAAYLKRAVKRGINICFNTIKVMTEIVGMTTLAFYFGCRLDKACRNTT